MADNEGTLESQIVHSMPAPIAVAFAEYQQERSMFKRLHRLVDVYETVMKYAAVLAIQNFYAVRLSTVFPEDDALIREQIDRPSLGSWARFLEEILKCFAEREDDLFCRELYLFQYKDFGHNPVQQDYLKQNGEAGRLLTLRNHLAHGATLSDDAAEHRLALYAPDLDFCLEKAAFFGDFPLFYVQGVHDSGALAGQSLMDASYGDVPLTTLATRAPAGDLTNHLIVHNTATDAILDLDPLLIYTECEESIPLWDQQHQLTGTATCLRRKVLFYNDLKDNRRITFLDYQQGHFSRFRTSEQSSLPKTFRQRFPKPQRSNQTIDWFDTFISDRTTHFVGREHELEEIERYVAGTARAILVVGEPGVGKSTLLAKWASDHQAVRHFIREGDTGTYQPIHVFDNLIRQVCERFGLEAESHLASDPLAYRCAFIAVLQTARDTTTEPVVVVIDGLDEAIRSAFHSSEPEFGLSFVDYLPDPPQLPAGVCLLVSARPELLDQPAFAAKFGRDKAKHLTLGKLAETEVRALLYQVRSKYDVLTAPQYVDAVVEQSEGNPLYLKMLVEDLAERQLVFGQIDTLPTGIIAYFERILKFIEDADRVSRFATGKEIRKAQRDMLETLVAQNVLTRAQADETLAKAQGPDEGQENFSSIEVLILYCLAKEPLALSQVVEVLQAEPMDVQHAFDLMRTVLVDEGQGRFAIFHSRFRDYVLHLDKHSDTRLQRYSGTIEHVQTALLAYCARWPEHKNPYAFRHYAEHLREAGKWNELRTLAWDDAFQRTQRQICADDPDLPLLTVQSALRGAMERDSAEEIAQLLLLHGQRMIAMTQESPVEACRRGSLARAWGLIDLYEHDISRLLLWHLLLVWELQETGRVADAQATLERLRDRPFPRLSKWQGKLAIDLLAQADAINHQRTLSLSQQILDDAGRREVSQQLVSSGQYLQARDFTRDIADPRLFSDGLHEVIKALAEAGQIAAAWESAALFEDNYGQDQARSVIATAQAKAGDIASALDSAGRITSEAKRAETLAALAAVRAQAGELQNAREILAAARGIAWAMTSDSARAATFRLIAMTQVHAGQTQEAQAALAEAVEIVHNIAEKSGRAGMLHAIASAQAEAGLAEAACDTLIAALEAAQAIEDLKDRTSQTEWLARTGIQQLTGFDYLNEGLTWCLQDFAPLSEELNQSWLFRATAEAQARAGDFAAALASARRIPSDRLRADALAVIGAAQARAGRKNEAQAAFTAAIQTALALDKRTALTKSVAVVRSWHRWLDPTGAGELDKSLWKVNNFAGKMARTLGLERYQQWKQRQEKEQAQNWFAAKQAAIALAFIAVQQAQAGEFTAALQTETLIHREHLFLSAIEPLHEIAITQARAGLFSAARETAERIDSRHRLPTLLAIATAQAQTGDREAARATFAATVMLATTVKDYSKGGAHVVDEAALVDIAAVHAKVGEPRLARDTLVLALKMSPPVSLDDFLTRYRARVAIAVAPALAGDMPTALRLVGMFDLDERSEALAKIAKLQIEAGDLLDAASTVGRIFYDPLRVEVLCALALAQAQAGQAQAARKTLVDASTRARTITDDLSRDKTFETVASTAVRLGEFVLAVKTARLIPDRQHTGSYTRDTLLTTIAKAQARAGQFTDAVQTSRSIEDAEKSTRVQAEIARQQEKGHEEQPPLTAMQAAIYRHVQDGAASGAAQEKILQQEEKEQEGQTTFTTTQHEARKHQGSLLNEAAAFAEAGDKDSFKRLLIPCAYRPDEVLNLCSLLARVYPEQAGAILQLVAKKA